MLRREAETAASVEPWNGTGLFILAGLTGANPLWEERARHARDVGSFLDEASETHSTAMAQIGRLGNEEGAPDVPRHGLLSPRPILAHVYFK